MSPAPLRFLVSLALVTSGLLGAEVHSQRLTSAPVPPDTPVNAARRPPSGLSYSASPARYAPGIRIPVNRPRVDGVVKRYSVSPALPAGVNLDPRTGTISGVAVVFTPPTDYTITARNAAGSTSVVLNLSTDLFGLISTSVVPGSVLQLNRSIDFIFNEDVDPASISLNTLRIATATGMSATGTFSFAPDPSGGIAQNVVRFQPNCPLQADLSDAGFTPGQAYTLHVPDEPSGSALTVRNVSGEALGVGRRVDFFTASGPSAATLFFDPVVGPPSPVVREVGSSLQQASYMELGGDSQNRVYFEYDPTSMTFVLEVPSFEAPRNLYADSASRVAILLELDQPISPNPLNLALLDVEYLAGNGAWRPMQVRSELLGNCTPDGATVRLTPIGPFPHAAQVRVVIQPGFQDLVGQTNLLSQSDFAVVPTEGIAFQSLTPADDDADELLESFLTTNLEDDEALFDVTPARWENGSLTAGFESPSDGGPGGNFDFYLQAGQVYLFDTTSQQVIGGPNGIPTTVITAIGGVLELRDFVIESGATFRVIGPNPLQIEASGRVEIHGALLLNGFPGRDVATLNTGHFPEPGGVGVAGGGKGGDASILTTTSTPRGGTGFGFANTPALGGMGGESAYAPSNLGKDARRPGGGGGGRLAGERTSSTQIFSGQSGEDGHPLGRGAETGLSPAQGGAVGPLIDTDGDDTNDHWGTRALFDATGQFFALREGEMSAPSGGSGGGAGGDAVPSNVFPHPNWSSSTDEKGGPGGGAAGQIRVRALGPIVFGSSGYIEANGGRGGRGENTLFLDHVGGSGAGASGGHVILETASWIDFTDGGTADPKQAPYGFIRAVGGAGADSAPTGGWSGGGNGGPGIIQLHTPHPTAAATRHPSVGGSSSASVFVPLAASQLVDPLEVTDPPAYSMVPTFGARSKARSKWIALGGADQVPGGAPDLVAFRFGGTETTAGPNQGNVLASGGTVQAEAPFLGPAPLGPDASILPSGVTLVLSANAIAPWVNDTQVPSRDMYLRSPELLTGWSLRLEESATPSTFQDFAVTLGVYDDPSGQLFLTVDASAGTPLAYSQSLASPAFSLIPRAFSVVTGGIVDALPDTSHVRITFEATGADSFGNPDEQNILVNTGDIADFNALVPGAAKFFRFQVEFDLDTMGAGLTPPTEAVSLDFLRVPFRF